MFTLVVTIPDRRGPEKSPTKLRRMRETPMKNTPKLGLSFPDLWFLVPYVSIVMFTVCLSEDWGNTCLSMDKINMFHHIHKALHNALHIYAFQTATRIDERVAIKF